MHTRIIEILQIHQQTSTPLKLMESCSTKSGCQFIEFSKDCPQQHFTLIATIQDRHLHGKVSSHSMFFFMTHSKPIYIVEPNMVPVVFHALP